jgi:hypothetical protein
VAPWVFAKKSSSTTTHTALAGLQQHTYQHKNFKGRPISDPVGSYTQPNFDFFRQVHLSLTDRISKVDLTAAADIDRTKKTVSWPKRSADFRKLCKAVVK